MDDYVELRNFSAHIWHGRVFLDGHANLDAALAAVELEGDGEVCMWHDWQSATVYRIDISATKRDAVVRTLNAIRGAVRPHNANASIACVPSSAVIEHHHWQSLP